MPTYTCQVCGSGKSYTGKDNLNQHIKEKHSLLKKVDDREYAILRDVLEESDFKRHEMTKYPKGFYPEIMCRLCEKMFSCNYSY